MVLMCGIIHLKWLETLHLGGYMALIMSIMGTETLLGLGTKRKHRLQAVVDGLP